MFQKFLKAVVYKIDIVANFVQPECPVSPYKATYSEQCKVRQFAN